MNQYKKTLSNQPHPFSILVFGAILLCLLSCEQNTIFDTAEPPLVQTPREAYLSALDSNGLASTQMARTWRMAGAQALADSVLLEAPFQETGYFRAADPTALAYRMELKSGELLQIDLVTAPDSILLFADLFYIEATDSTENFRHLFNAENYRTDSLTYEIQEGGTYLLRIQPELLASCRYTLQLIVQPVYGAFPVSGKGNRDVWSFFGDPRDGGRRKHKGVDIFARRGTPVVAATAGRVRSVRDRGLGGKQVWLYDSKRRQSLYYAHLDSQLVRKDQWVKTGDTLGLVGNTGNARNTRPHLHFSIYRRGYGAIDPHPFIAYQAKQAPAVRADTLRLGQLARVRRSNTRLRAAPQPQSTTLATLDRHLPLQVLAASKAWYRVRSPDGRSGYLPDNSLENIERAISQVTLTEATELLQSPYPEAVPVSAVQSKADVAVIGKNGSYQLVRAEDGEIGWMPILGR